jgi:hypothetical protein
MGEIKLQNWPPASPSELNSFPQEDHDQVKNIPTYWDQANETDGEMGAW